MNFPLYIAQRYLYTGSRNNAINIISKIAGVGVVLASAALFIVLSGFAGLKDFSVQFTSLVDPDLKAVPKTGKSFFVTEDELNRLRQATCLQGFSKIIEEDVLLGVDDKHLMATLKAVDSNYQRVTAIDSMLYLGSWFDATDDEIVAGWGIANELSFGVLDYAQTIRMMVPKPKTLNPSPLDSYFTLQNALNVGVFQINEDLDHKYVFSSLALGQKLLGYQNNQVSALEFRLKNPEEEAKALVELQNILGDKTILKNRLQLNDALYKMLNTEYLAVYLIFTLVLVIALFNVIGSIIMMILDKKPSLSTLYSLGLDLKDIRKVFFFQGSLMSVAGGVLGLILGLTLVWAQQQFSLIKITPSLAYPVSIKATNILLVLLTISVLGVLASKIAARRIDARLV